MLYIHKWSWHRASVYFSQSLLTHTYICIRGWHGSKFSLPSYPSPWRQPLPFHSHCGGQLHLKKYKLRLHFTHLLNSSCFRMDSDFFLATCNWEQIGKKKNEIKTNEQIKVFQEIQRNRKHHCIVGCVVALANVSVYAYGKDNTNGTESVCVFLVFVFCFFSLLADQR